MHEVVAARAAAEPDAVAVTCGGVSLTYAGLDGRVGRLAGYLRGVGVGPEVVVGVCVERGLDMVVAVLAVWKAGGAFLPLDPGYPAERLGFMLADSGALVLVGHSRVAGQLAVGTAAVVWLDDPDTAALVSSVPGGVPTAVIAAGQAAYVMYTSGLTGQPKGVVVSHRSLVNFLASMAQRPGLGGGDVVLAVTTLGFDIAGLELWLPLVTGARLVVAGREAAGSPGVLAGEIGRSGATVLQATPATWRMLVDDGWAGSAGLVALCGGEALPRGLAEAVRGRAAALWNLYGPTETTIWSLCGQVTAGGDVTLGYPVANTQIYVVDRYLRPVPAGVAGELLIGGAGVARGYHGRAGLTAGRFIADPFAAGGSRLYRTGDRARWRLGGELEFLGRADHQVKVRGFRIEPGEVEAALAAHPAVASAVVVAQGEDQDRRLAAYVVPAAGGRGIPGAGELREFLGRVLPGYMVPGVFIELAGLPLTANGKLDRAALPAPGSDRGGLAGPFLPPRTPAEEVIAAIWAQVLGMRRVGVSDNFFELGGHSLVAVQVISRVRAAFERELPLAVLFDHPTVGELAAVVGMSGPGALAPPIVPAGRGRRLPLSFAQQRLWFLDQLEPGSAEYNIPPIVLRMAGPLDEAALRRALETIVARHEVLRTRLVTIDGAGYQVIDPAGGFALRAADLSQEADPAGRARELAAVEAVTPFDLAAGPLLRGRLLRLGTEDHVLILVLHHVVSDDWSADIFRRELSVLYTAYRAGRPSPLADLAVQYADFAVWQRDWLSGEVLGDQLAYWRERLAGAAVLELPADRPRPAVRSPAGGSVPFSVPAAAADGLRAAARAGGATMFMTLLAGLAVLLGRYAGQDDVVVGTPVANRGRAETEDLIGFFVNSLAVRADLSGDPAFGELLARVRRGALDDYAHQDLPFEQLVDALSLPRDRSRHPLFQVMIAYAKGGPGALEFAGLRSGRLGVPVIAARFDLTFAFTETGAALSGDLIYSTDLFDRATAGRMAGHLVTLLEAVAGDAGQPLSALAMLSAGERDQLISQGHGGAGPVGSVASLVAASVAQRPDAAAVSCGGEVLTYGGLQARAARLAHHLCHLGVGPESVVGLYLDASPAMVVAILAVLYAGGAYLALDPGYPPERLAWMFADSQASVLAGDHRITGLAAAGITHRVQLDDPVTAAAIGAWPAVPPAGRQRHHDQAAYVNYTSGSTGRPKGVTVTHHALANLVQAQCHALDLVAGDVALQLASFSFDVAGQEVFAPLAAGAQIVIAGPQTRRSGPALQGLLRDAAVTAAAIPPTALPNLDPASLPDLRVVSTGGEPCPPALAAAWADGRRFINAYGPTETTVCAALAIDPETAGPLPIGGPIRNTRTYVLDRSMHTVPIGVPGELHIAGAGLARGYHRQPSLTAHRFIPDPYAADGSRLYVTGDRVQWRPDGQLEFLRRADDQVKLHGHRIELGEVEAALAAHPQVASAIVAMRGDDGRQRLAAYLVPAGPVGGIPSTSDLRAFLSTTLPDHMIPAAFATISAIPLTRNGKIDRDALPAPGSRRPDLADEYVGPRTEVERVLAGVWAEVLGLDRVGIEDNFFELGGDSIVSIQAVSRARSLGAYITPADLFEHQTIVSLAAVAVQQILADAEQGPVVGEFPLSPIQNWFFGRDLPKLAHFNQSMLLKITEPVQPGPLRAALSALTEHHDALRSRYVRYGAEWIGRNVNAEPNELLWVVEAGDIDGWDEDAYLDAHASAAHASLDLEHGPLARFVLFNRGVRGQLLLAVVHHLAVDGVSWRILQEDLAVAYGQAERGLPVQLAPKTTSFKRWSERLTEFAGSAECAAEGGYWRKAEQAASPLPCDYDGDNTIASERSVSATLSAEQTAQLLREVPNAYRTQINDVLLTALGTVLTDWSQAASALVDLEAHGREDLGPDVDVSRTVGWFTSFYPVALSAAADRGDPGAALRRTKEYLRAIPRRGLGYGLLRYLAGGVCAAAAEVSFNYLGQSGQAASATSGRFRPLGGSLGTSRSQEGQRTHLLEINAEVTANGCLVMVWTYSGQVHDEVTVARLARRYAEVLGELIEHCCSPGVGGYTPSDFPLARLDQAAVDVIQLRAMTVIEDVYPLTALQEGMLFHSRLAPGSGVYWVQNGLLLDGELDLAALRRAWELVFSRHAVLRSTVVWDGVPGPLSVVSRSVPLPWQVLDWSGVDEGGQREAVAGYMAADRARGADFSQPTLVRIALMRLGGGRHQLVWSYHHLLLDGWSVPIVLGELIEAYHCYRAGEQPPHHVHRPFRDFVAWITGQDLAAAGAYWQEQLRGFTAATSLEVERSTAERGYHTHRVRVSARATAALAEFARRHRLTLNTVVQGAWAVLMAAYSGTGDVVFGVTTSGRGDQLDGMESMVGSLINTTPAPVRVDPDEVVATWLRRLQKDQVQARRFEHVPLVDIQACSDIPHGQPLFNYLLLFENFPAAALDEGKAGSAASGLRVDENLSREQSNYPLTVVAGPGPELSIGLAYDRARFDSGTIERMADHLAVLVEAIADDPGQRVGDLSVGTAAERHQILITWNDTVMALRPAGGVHELVAEHAASRPGALAVEYPGQSLTYAELDERANRLARYLQSLGVGNETVVGLCLDRGTDMITALLAIWKAGGAYLPLDPSYPAERLTYMLADSQATVLVSHHDVVQDLLADEVVWLDDPPTMAAIRACRADGLATATHPDQLAYVIYTSGSTGRPKGIGVCHRDIAALIASGDYITIGPDDVVAQASTISFDAATFEIWGALANGATLAGIERDVLVSPERLSTEIEQRHITVLTLVTALFNRLAADAPYGLRKVRHLLFGGEAVDPVSVRRVLALGRPGRLLHMYGPTETTSFATWQLVTRVTGDMVPIGRPLANMRAYVLDRRLVPVPIGVPGELLLGGIGVARGYRGRADLTAERFVPNLFTADGTRLYRTGDRARWLPSGELEFLGRIDYQVKVRGVRIEPGEVETALAAHPAVMAALVTARADGGEVRLVAYLIPASLADGIPPTGDLRTFLRASLPDYMIPAAFVELAAFPLTSNGKIDRSALLAPDTTRPDVAEFAAPRTATERTLASIWAEVLGLEGVGIADNFFELGGHSLLVTQVISRIRTAFGIELAMSAVFDQPTVAGLAPLVDATAPEAGSPPIVPVQRDRPLPLSHAQQRLWFLDQLEPGSAEYNVPLALRLTGPIDIAALGAALDAIVARHELLRTRLVANPDGVAYQVIDPPSGFGLVLRDLSDEPDGLAAAVALAAADAATPFDLSTGPLLRGALFRLGSDDHVLNLCMHHVVSDEWSTGVFRRELAVLYGAFRRGEPSPLEPLEVQYADFAVWQRDSLSRDVLEDQLAYWRDRLADAPVLNLPTDRPRPAVRSSAGALSHFQVPGPVAAGLQALSSQTGATMFMTLLSAFAFLLSRYADQDDIVVGTPIANRNRAETENLIGFFVNTLALRLDLSGDPTFTELISRVRDRALAAYAHQDLPFEQLVEVLQPERDRSRHPLFQVLFGVERVSETPVTLEAANAELISIGAAVARFDLTLGLGVGAAGIDGHLEYSTSLFERATADRMVRNLLTILVAIAADPGRRLSELPVLGGEEYHRLITAWNDSAVPVPPVGGVHELIATQAGANPDAVAVVSGEESLTYAGLEDRANRLACHLRGLGVRPEVVVGLCLPRGAGMVIALVAVWKAGGVYLPMDPDYPAERLGFMLADSRASVLVCDNETADLLPGGRVRLVVIDDQATRAEIAAQATGPAVATHPDQGAYVIYTSGLTGRPKGVLVPHRGLVSLVETRVGFGVDGNDVVLQFASFSFDASIWELVIALALGGTLVVATPRERSEPMQLAALAAAAAVTVASLPPSLLGALEPADLAGVTTLIATGEPLRRELAGAWGPGRRLFNGYGPTETTVGASAALYDPEIAGEPSIGTPMANMRVYVLDSRLRPVPVGVPGELCIGGLGVARGYISHPALSAERFVADPFAADGSRLYHSGDRARWCAHGELEFLGRIDDQVKVRGHRVELGEVEAALRAHPQVSAAAVVARNDTGTLSRLLAYLVPADQAGGIPDVGVLRTFLRQTLPDYLIPAAFTELTALPLTPNRKLDRAALPAPEGLTAAAVSAYVAPRTPVEEILAEAWADVLRVERVGATDNFFELGGDSILSIQAVARVRASGLHITPGQMFERQTIASLAVVAGTETSVGAEQGPVVGAVPLTPILQWFFDRGLANPSHYNQSIVLRVTERIDPELLQRALAALVEHHDALRLRFTERDGRWTAHNASPEHRDVLEVIDLAGMGNTAAMTRMEEAATTVQHGLDLAEGPLLRCLLFESVPADRGQGQDQDQVILLVAHHTTVDGVSWRILLDDLVVACGQLERGDAVELPAKTTSFQRWAEELRALAHTPQLTAETDYWLRAVGEPGGLPRDHPAGWNDLASARSFRARLDEVQTSRLLHQVPSAYRTQINDVLLAALGVTLNEWARRQVLVDIEGHGREDIGPHVDLSRTVGWFTSIYPVRLHGDISDLGALIKRSKEQLWEVPRHGLGYGILRYLTDTAWSAVQSAELSFNYLGQLDQAVPSAARFRQVRRTLGHERSESGERTHLIEVHCRVAGGRLELTWTYSSQIHNRATVERLAYRYLDVLGTLIDHCCQLGVRGYTPSDFPLAQLDQATIDRIQIGTEQSIDDIYPLTPLQQGMLFHTLLEPGSGIYHVQNGMLLVGELDEPAMARAWQLALARHPVLRSRTGLRRRSGSASGSGAIGDAGHGEPRLAGHERAGTGGCT